MQRYVFFWNRANGFVIQALTTHIKFLIKLHKLYEWQCRDGNS